MPNWCYNKLIVSGDEAVLSSFEKAAVGNRQTYNNFVGNEWAVFDEIRIAAIAATPPALGGECSLNFHSLFPVPDSVRCMPYDRVQALEIARRIGVPAPDISGYDWESQNWGCKWGATSVVHLDDNGDGDLEYNFDTAWSPPIAWLEKVSTDYPDLLFSLTYEEAGMGFRGSIAFEAGTVVEQIESDIMDELSDDDDSP